MDEKMVVKYIEGEVHVPDDLWLLVKRYRELGNQVDKAGLVYPVETDRRMNALYDALVAL